MPKIARFSAEWETIPSRPPDLAHSGAGFRSTFAQPVDQPYLQIGGNPGATQGDKAKADHKCTEACKEKCKAEHKCTDACKEKCAAAHKDDKKK